MDRYPRQSVWETLADNFLVVELDEIKKYINNDLIDENTCLWNELQGLKEIVKDIYSFDSSISSNNTQNLSLSLRRIVDSVNVDSPSEQSGSYSNLPNIQVRIINKYVNAYVNAMQSCNLFFFV